METMYWLLIFIVLLVIEIGTMGLTTIWFAGGALAAFIMGIIGFGTGVQIAVFSIVSIVLLVSTRPIALKYFNKERQKTNAESLIGKQALVLEEVDTLHNKGSGRGERPGVVGEDGRTVWSHCKKYSGYD